jgi:copper transport protein
MLARWVRWIVVTAAVGAVIVIVTAPRAEAHAALVESTPEPGAELANTPGVVTLTFSEPLIDDLSRATVTAPDGQRFDGVAARREIRVDLQTTSPGVYEVDWKTVSPLDGHTLRGDFRFGVGVDPGPGAAGTTSTAPRSADLLVAIARAVEYAALLFAVGAVTLRILATRAPALPWAQPPIRIPIAVALAAGITVVLGEGLLAAPSPSLGALVDYFATGQGVARLVRIAAEGLALAATLGAGTLVAPLLAIAFAALASAGHAAAASPAQVAVASDTLHLVAAGVWAGGILALATTRPPDGWRGRAARELLVRFTPVAIVGFAATVVFGIVRSTQELAALDELVTTGYGQALGVKVLLVGVALALSVRAWTRRARSHRGEATVVLAVALVAALLAAFPLPPRRLAEADEAAHPAAGGTELPAPGDLTMGADAGDTLVGLTVRPGTPGRNRVITALLPPRSTGTPPPAELVVGGQRLDLEPCGPTCRSTTVTLDGGEQLDVHVGGPGGGTAAFVLPELPAPDATELLDRLTRRMDALDTYQLDEVFRPAEPPIRSRWTIVAPDQLHITFATGAETVRIGSTSYRLEPGAAWETSRDGPQLRVPAHIWDVPERRAAHVVGSESVDGVDTQIISFFGTTAADGGSPIWYRLWVDDTGLVHRAEMRAESHFMDHRYFAYDAPASVSPPT